MYCRYGGNKPSFFLATAYTACMHIIIYPPRYENKQHVENILIFPVELLLTEMRNVA